MAQTSATDKVVCQITKNKHFHVLAICKYMQSEHEDYHLTGYFKSYLEDFSYHSNCSYKKLFPWKPCIYTLMNLKHEHLSQVFSELPLKETLGLPLLIIDQVYKTTL